MSQITLHKKKKMITVTEADMFLQPDKEIYENFQ